MAAKKKVTPVEVDDKAEEAPVKKKSSVSLVSFEVTAVIPTQQYGNIQPKIVVSAKTIEEARDTVMPVIVDMYRMYAEEPLNGKTPRIVGKITEVTKVITPEVVTTEDDVEVVIPTQPQVEQPVVVEKPEPVKKAEKAIENCLSLDALKMIEDQIKNSVKIAEDNKPSLYALLLKKRVELDK